MAGDMIHPRVLPHRKGLSSIMIIPRHAWHVWYLPCVKRVEVTTRCTDVNSNIVWRVPPCNMVDNFVKDIVAGSLDLTPPLAAMYFEYEV